MSTNLIPCKYFLNNSCRFGDNCRFSHSRNVVGQGGNVFGGGRPFGTGFGSGTQDVHGMQAKAQTNLDAIVETVKKDFQEWELGKIWPLSSYGPVGGKPCLPGLEDVCVEELRYKFLQNNRMPPDLTQEMRNMQLSRQTYQQPTPQIREIIERVVVKGERIDSISSSNTSLSTWGSPAATTAPVTTGIFGGAGAGSSSVFGTPQSQNVFGGTPSMFQQSTSNVFGTTASTSTSISIFGSSATQGFPSLQKSPDTVETMDGSAAQQATSSIFGNQQNPSGLFPALTNQTSPFQSQQQASVFGTSFQPQANVFQQQSMPQSTSLFPAATTQQPVQQNPFQSTGSPIAPQSQSNIFQAPSPFAPTNNPSMISQPSVTTSSPGLFNLLSQPATAAPVSNQTSFFGSVQSQPATMGAWSTPAAVQSQSAGVAGSAGFGGPNAPPSSQDQIFVYSEESDLAMEEIEAFKADQFTLENIPIHPPAKAYCNM